MIDLSNINLDWHSAVSSTGTQGSFLKTSVVVNGKRYYIKAPRFDEISGFYGYESAYEVVACRLAKKLGVPCVKQELQYVDIDINGRVYGANVCVSKSYRKEWQKKLTLEDAVAMYGKPGELKIDTAREILGDVYLSKVLMFDFIIINRDRHGANIEIYKDSSGKYKPAPLFDNGLSFMCMSLNDDDIRNFDVARDYRVNNFMGHKSLKDNLEFVNKSVKLNALKETDRSSLFRGLTDILTKEHRDKIWETIVRRCDYVTSL